MLFLTPYLVTFSQLTNEEILALRLESTVNRSRARVGKMRTLCLVERDTLKGTVYRFWFLRPDLVKRQDPDGLVVVHGPRGTFQRVPGGA